MRGYQMMENTFRCFGLSESKTVTIRIFGPSLDMKCSFGRRMSSLEKSFVPSTCYCSTSQTLCSTLKFVIITFYMVASYRPLALLRVRVLQSFCFLLL